MKIGNKILNKLIKNKEIISANIVGSYMEKKNLDKIGDIDVVVVCKKLSKKIIEKLTYDIKNINIKGLNKEFLVNSTFGPLKLTKHNHIPIHLMIYDIDSHIDHVTSSPFTCYDWERSKLYRGIPLKKIYPVNYLQLRDFFTVRRNSKEYLKDLSRNRISIRKYFFTKKRVRISKKYIKIDERNRGEFVYHIINFLIINLNKFLSGKNIKLSDKMFNKIFLKITNTNKSLLRKFKILKKNKESKILIYDKKIIEFGKNFIKKYEKFLEKIKNEQQIISISRHAKTKVNYNNRFLGSGLDPDINLKKSIKKIRNKFDIIITSKLRRSKSSVTYFSAKKIISNSLLNEISYGQAEGMKFSLFKNQFPYIVKSWNKNKDIRFPDGENTGDVLKRVRKFLLFLKKINKKKILIISHSFFLRVLIGNLLNLDLKKIYKLKIDHLRIFEIIKTKNNFFSNIDRKEILNFYRQLND